MKQNRLLVIILGLTFLVFSCQTDDVDPIVDNSPAQLSLSFDKTAISENGGKAMLIASLNKTVEKDVTFRLVFSGSAALNIDYLAQESMTIKGGNLTSSIELIALQDSTEEGKENIRIGVSNLDGAEFSNQMAELVIEDDDVPFEISLIINEVLYDPSNSGLDGDANGDGVYSQAEDEFIEIVNLSSQPADLSGYTIFDDENLAINEANHTIPSGTIIQPGKSIVIFGGGAPKGNFGGATIQTSTSGDFNMNNAGDNITIKDASGKIVLTFDIEPYSNNPNESYTRNPDLTGEFEQHSNVNDKLFSPGTKTDGTAF